MRVSLAKGLRCNAHNVCLNLKPAITIVISTSISTNNDLPEPVHLNLNTECMQVTAGCFEAALERIDEASGCFEAGLKYIEAAI